LNRFTQIYSWCEAHKPKVILEIGTWNGHNAARMMNEIGDKQKVRYVGFDLFEDGDESHDEIERNAKKRCTEAEVREYLKSYTIELVKGNTRETLPEYVKDKKPFVDMAFIDGGHSQGTIKSDLLTVLNVVKVTGTIFMDDYYYGCQIPHVGAQTVLCNIQAPYTLLPIADKANDGSLIKIVQINMRDIPQINKHDVPEEKAWKFNPAA
jgi:predicted O-methyltransferase YrrM